MRKLISTEKRRVLENFSVNNDGTIVEVGGNVAAESIEQFGHTVPAPAAFTSGAGSYPAYNVLSGITEVVDIGGWTTAAESLPADVDEGVCKYDPTYGMYLMKVKGVKYIADNSGKTIKLNGNIIYTPDSNDTCTFTPAGLVFKPFFTEAQYQALLALIK